MKKIQIAAQLYSFREQIKTVEGLVATLKKLKEMGYDAVQLSSAIPPVPEGELLAILDGEGISAPTAHEKSLDIVSQPERTAERLLKLRCPHVAYPFPHIPLKDMDAALQIARSLESATGVMRKAGVTLSYHNHDVEFVRYGGRAMLDVIYENAPSLQGEIDTFWVQAGGSSPLDWVKRMNKRMDVIHLKDFGIADGAKCRSGVMMPIGSGNLDWKAIIPAAEKGGVKVFVVEHDGDCADPFESFKSSLEYLNANFVK
jgi:sugar phosphate isomerase/epimerase